MSETPGGYRPGAGRKSQWSRPTKMIRLPAEFEAELLAIAHRMDENQLSESESKFSLEQIETAIAGVVMSIPPPDRRQAKKLFKKLMGRLMANP